MMKLKKFNYLKIKYIWKWIIKIWHLKSLWKRLNKMELVEIKVLKTSNNMNNNYNKSKNV
jgi:hypothetical protein